MSVVTASAGSSDHKTDYGAIISQLEQEIGQRNDQILEELKQLTSGGRSKVATTRLYSDAENTINQTINGISSALEELKRHEELAAINAQVANVQGELSLASQSMQGLLKKDIAESKLENKPSKIIARCLSALENVQNGLFQISEPDLDEPIMTVFLSVVEQENGLILGFDSEIDTNDFSQYTQQTVASVNRVLNKILDLEISAIEDGEDNGLVAKFGKITTIEDLIDVIQTFVISFSEMISFYPELSKAILSECSSEFNQRLCRECVPRMYPKTADNFEEFRRNLEGFKGLNEVMRHFGWEDNDLLHELVSEFPSSWQFYTGPTEKLTLLRDFMRDEPYQPYQKNEAPPPLQPQLQANSAQQQPASYVSADSDAFSSSKASQKAASEQQATKSVPQEPVTLSSEKQNPDAESDVEDGWGWGDSNGESFLSDVESLIGDEAADDKTIEDADDSFQRRFEDHIGDETLVEKPVDFEESAAAQEMTTAGDREATVIPSEDLQDADVYDEDSPASSLGRVIAIFRQAEASSEPLEALCALYKALSKTHYASAFPLALYSDTAMLCKSISDRPAQDDLLSFANGVFSEAAFSIQCEQERLIAKFSENIESTDLAETTNAMKQQILKTAKCLSNTDDRKLAILQSLTEQACCCFIDAVLEQQDISEQTALTLHSCIGLLAELERLFVSISDTVPSWIKLQRLASLLIANLDEIRDMIISSALLDYSDTEVEHIIRALFVDSARRSQVLSLVAHEYGTER